MRPMTLTEKVLARASGRAHVVPGEEIWATADRMIMNDSSGPRRIAGLVAELGGVRDPSRLVVASDHFAPAANVRHAEILTTTPELDRVQRLLLERYTVSYRLVMLIRRIARRLRRQRSVPDGAALAITVGHAPVRAPSPDDASHTPPHGDALLTGA